jgi:hypothetical protein
MDRKSFLGSALTLLAVPFVAWRSRTEGVPLVGPSIDANEYEMNLAYEVVERTQQGDVTILRPGKLYSVGLVPKRDIRP